MKKVKNILNISLFLVPIILFGCLNIFQGDRPTISQIENRALKTKPVFSMNSLLTGGYLREFEDYYADTFIYRDKLVAIANNSSLWRGIRDEDNATIVAHKGANLAETK